MSTHTSERVRSRALLDVDAARDARATELEWVTAARRGEARAFRAIVERHQRGMYALAARLLAEPADAEDAVQEAFARAFCRIDQFDPRYRLSTWLYRIVLNLCRDLQRSPRSRERPAHEVDEIAAGAEGAGPDALLISDRRAHRVHAALSSLRPAYREVIVLKDLQELSYEEIRSLTGTPITALKIRVIRARKQLRKALLEQAQ